MHRKGMPIMMKHEFEEIAGYEVSDDTYNKVIEPMYMATYMSKYDFVKLINRKAVELKKEYKPTIKKMRVRNRSGLWMTPNHCYCYIQYVDMVGVDIKSGKIIVKELDEKTLAEIYKSGHSLDLSYDYDFDYMSCVDTHKKPIQLTWSF